jgi:hypothetical protein
MLGADQSGKDFEAFFIFHLSFVIAGLWGFCNDK